RSAAPLVGARQRRRIEIGADQAAARACALDLGNEAVAARCHGVVERFDEAARRRGSGGLALERRHRALRLRLRDGAPLIIANAREHIAHAPLPLVMATSFSKTRRALPSSIASAA